MDLNEYNEVYELKYNLEIYFWKTLITMQIILWFIKMWFIWLKFFNPLAFKTWLIMRIKTSILNIEKNDDNMLLVKTRCC